MGAPPQQRLCKGRLPLPGRVGQGGALGDAHRLLRRHEERARLLQGSAKTVLTPLLTSLVHLCQVSFGVHSNEERAARMYDRAMIIEKGRAAKTNFSLADYEAEVAQYKAFCKQW